MRKALVVLIALSVVPALFAQGTGSGTVQTATITLTSAQLQHLNSTPVQLIAAPGTGQMINVISGVGQYKPGAAAYAAPSGGTLRVYLGNPANDLRPLETRGMAAAGFLDQTTNQVRALPQVNTDAPQTSMENQAVVLANDGGAEWTSGDGTVTITVHYTVVALQ